MIVVDTLIIGHFWLPGDFNEACVSAWRKDPAWCVPYVWRPQFRNLVVAQMRRQALDRDMALKLLASAEAMFNGNEFFIPYGQVLECMERCRLSAYSCEFVALAEDLNLRLVTLDRALLKSFPKRAIHLEEFTR